MIDDCLETLTTSIIALVGNLGGKGSVKLIWSKEDEHGKERG